MRECLIFQEGSLRVIRNGIGIEEAASVDLPGVKRLFSLRYKAELDNYILVSLANETHILELKGEELEDTQLLGKFILFNPSEIAFLQIWKRTNRPCSLDALAPETTFCRYSFNFDKFNGYRSDNSLENAPCHR